MFGRRGFVVAALLASPALGLVASGCDRKKTEAAPTASASVSAAAPVLTPELASKVLARVGDRAITLGDYAATLDRMDPFERLRYQSADRRKQLLEELIDLELLAAEARRRGLDKTPETEQRVREMLRDELLRAERAQVPEANALPEAEVRRYYEEHRDDFREPERRRVAHIAFPNEAAAKALLPRALTATPAEWGKLVAEHSLDTREKPSASVPLELAGDLGIVGPPGHPRGDHPRVPEELRAAVFEIGQLGGVLPRVVAAGGQFHVVRMTGKTDARDRTFAEAERSIRVALVQQKIRDREAALEQELAKKYPVTLNEQALSGVAVPAPSAADRAP